MRAFPCSLLLVLVLFCQPTTADEQKGLEIIASRMEQLKRELLDLDVFCKEPFRRDVTLLRETALKLDSARGHFSDNLSLYSSRAGLVGGTMTLAGLIPSPMSPPLLYYGSYLSLSSTIGHVSNAVIVEESYDLFEVAQVIQNLNEYYEVILRVEDAYDTLLKLQPEAILRGKNGGTLSKETQEKILREIEKLWDIKINLEKKRKITLTETIDYINSLLDFLRFVKDVLGTVILEDGYNESKRNAGGLPKQADRVLKVVKDISAHRSIKRLASSIVQYGNVQTQALLNAGMLETAFVGISCYFTIVTESQNIKEVLRKMQEREELIRLLRYVADDMERVCNGSPYCVQGLVGEGDPKSKSVALYRPMVQNSFSIQATKLLLHPSPWLSIF